MADEQQQVTRGLKEKVDDSAANGSPLSISSNDVADFAPSKEEGGRPVEGTVSIVGERPADAMLDVASEGDVAAKIRTDQNRVRVEDMLGAGQPVAEIEIGEEERAMFLDVLVSGDRLVMPFSLYGGRIKGKFRSRSQGESDAIITRLAYECRETIHSEMEYATRMRHMLLGAQVAELQGEELAALAKPLKPIRKGKEVTPINWLDQVDLWADKEDGLVAAIYQELVRFESKYWTMVKHAGDQDFWPPVESTSA